MNALVIVFIVLAALFTFLVLLAAFSLYVSVERGLTSIASELRALQEELRYLRFDVAGELEDNGDSLDCICTQLENIENQMRG